MRQLKEEISRFLMEDKNFEVIWELYSIVPDRAAFFRKIVADFLAELNRYLTERLKETNWVIEADFEEGKGNDYPRVGLTKEKWLGYFGVYVEFEVKEFGLYYGLRKNIKKFPHLVDNEAVEKEANQYSRSNPGFYKGKWWFCYKYIDDNLSDFESVRRFLPANRETTINECADILIEFGEDIEGAVLALVEATRLETGKKK
jgi:hypothetical protein